MPKQILIGLDRTVAFHPVLARMLGGIHEALYLQQLYYWSDKGSRQDGFIYKTKGEIEQETCINRYQQDKVRSRLEALGVLETKLIKADGAPTLHYRIDIDRVNELLRPAIGFVEGERMEKLKSTNPGNAETDDSITKSTQRLLQRSNLPRAVAEESVKRKQSLNGPEDIVITKPYQAKAKYIAQRLGTRGTQLTSLIKICRERPESQVDAALSHAIDATVQDKTSLFFKTIYQLPAI